MLINLRDICKIAEQNNMAVAAVNTPSLEAVRAAIDVAEETGYPIIIMHAEVHEEYMPLTTFGPIATSLAERSSAQICIHLDHCEHLSYAHRALELGFTGIMFDGSMLPYERNIEYSCSAADMCADYGAGLECELGSMGARGAEDVGSTSEETGAIYTDPDMAKDFIEKTGLDVLACSFGTVHGLYKGEPHLNFDVLYQIRERANIPLVMHGGSGLSDRDFITAINGGIRKINYYTYSAKYAGDAVRSLVAKKETDNPDTVVYWHDMTSTAYETLVNTYEHIVKTFANGAPPLA